MVDGTELSLVGFERSAFGAVGAIGGALLIGNAGKAGVVNSGLSTVDTVGIAGATGATGLDLFVKIPWVGTDETEGSEAGRPVTDPKAGTRVTDGGD